MPELSERERIILTIDTSDDAAADRLARIARDAGARFIKLGTEYSSATSWERSSELAADHGLDWVADAKLHDIPNTVNRTVTNLARLKHPPFAITIHTAEDMTIEGLRAAQTAAGDIKMLGVTVLTSLSEANAESEYGITVAGMVMRRARKAQAADLGGIVCSPQEVGRVKRGPDTRRLFVMTPGTRSVAGVDNNQARIGTPAQAIWDGADLIVVGSQVTEHADSAAAYEAIVAEIQEARG